MSSEQYFQLISRLREELVHGTLEQIVAIVELCPFVRVLSVEAEFGFDGFHFGRQLMQLFEELVGTVIECLKNV
jgi:hypothetical protein